jgi:uncharacterized membrane protein YphA (DoxX/SURF4 family)
MKDRRRWLVVVAPRILLGAVLLGAGLLKAGSGEAGAEALANYRLMPAALNQLLAVVLPWWEIMVGSMLILGLWVRACAGFAALLVACFALAVGSALVRGLDIDCGCFGTTTELKAGLPHVATNGFLLALALWVARRSGPQTAGADSSEARPRVAGEVVP